MSPSGSGGDLDITFNPKSIIANAREVTKAFEDVGKGVAGAGDRADAAMSKFVENSIKLTSRAEQAQKRYLQSLELTAATYGKQRTELDRLSSAQEVLLRRYKGQEDAINAINRAYATMKQRAREVEQEQRGSGALAFRAARDLFEGRTAFAEVQAGKFLGSLSGLPLVLGSVAAGLAAVGLAAFESYKHLAAYGVEIEKLKVTTGLSTNEVYQFGIAAKASGGSIESFVTIMRMLDKGLADSSAAGKTARDELRSLGVVMRDAGTGQTRPMSEVIVDLSKALNDIEDPAKRGVAAINVLGRGGLSALPEILKINDGLKAVRQSGLDALQDSDVKKWAGWNLQLTIAEEKLTAIWRRLQDMMGTAGSSALAAVNEDRYGIFAKIAKLGLESGLGPIGFAVSRGLNTSGGRAAAGSSSVDSADLPLATLLHPGQYSNRGSLPQDMEALRSNVEKLKKTYDEARESYDKFPTNTRTELWKTELAAVNQAGAAYRAASDNLKELEKIEAHRVGILEKARELGREQVGYYRFGSGLNETIVTEEDMIKSNIRSGRGPRLLRPGESAPFDLSTPEYPFAPLPSGMNSLGFVSPSSDRSDTNYLERQSEVTKGILDSEKERQRVTLAGIEAEAKAQEKLLEYRGEHGSEIATAIQVASIRQSALNQEYGLTKDLKKLQEESNQVQLDMQLKIAEVQKRQAESIAHVAGGLFSTLFTSPSKFGGQLSSTLRSAALGPITQGLGDLTATALHPLIFGPTGEGGIAGALHGAFGGGRTSPVGTRSDPIAVEVTNIHEGSSQYSFPTFGGATSAKDFASFIPGRGGSVSQGAIPSSLLSLVLGGVMQSASPAFRGAYPSRGGSGTEAVSSAMTSFGGDTEYLGTTYSSGGSPASYPIIGGPGPFSGESLGFPTGSGGAVGPGGGVFLGPGGGGGTAGLSRAISLGRGLGSGSGFNLGALKEQFGIGAVGVPGVDANTPGTTTTTFGSVLSSSGAKSIIGAGGFALAKAGLTGYNEGTAVGTLEGAAGGAMVGFQYGGPIGAAVGAAIGFGIGAGEMIAGVESQGREATRLVKQQYNVNIDRHTATQIVELANSKYAGHVSLAVTSPEVRQMIGLYAAGRGQAGAFPQSAGLPHGGSLVEAGGQLQQGATYQYGNPYQYQSSLPLYGGGSAGQLPTPGGNTYVAFSFDGKSAGDALTGNWVTPGFVQAQNSRAWAGSNGRMQDSLTMSDPGSIVG